MKRKLAAILAADVVGYSKLMAEGWEAEKLIEKAQAAIDRAVIEAPEDVRQFAPKRAVAFALGDAEAAVAAA